MAMLEVDAKSLQPWYNRRASARRVSAHSMLLLLSFVPITLSLALLIAADITVPATTDGSLFNVRALVSFNDANPVLQVGTFGYCVGWAPDNVDTVVLATPSRVCYYGNGYSMSAVVQQFFDNPSVSIGFIASIAPALSALYPLTTALVFLVLVATALPCFIPPVFAVALSWLATASSIAAVGCTFSIALVTRSRLAGNNEYVFEYGVHIWALFVGAISALVFTVLLTASWWLRRQLSRRSSDETTPKPGSAHHAQVLEFSSEEAPKELPGGKNSHRHELFNTGMGVQGRIESGAEERYELDTKYMRSPSWI
ncbi:hypothetical protein O1611_g3177 [Lasiodiplodia mahajangana]|uniref:Uncharacterized protein n=1 Tax=Lasiodiplodia mahajangana TaxID=1108764 RepID=A0ACC2JT71_9PEZI|nr:hypothetical protein O1611_g3177 [Lasiodiplodia mahajangana]